MCMYLLITLYRRKKISVVDDLSNIGQIPCARSSLMSGIASGVAIGFIRGMTTSELDASPSNIFADLI